MMHEPEHSHEQRVRMKAYEIWLNEGRPEGREERHWAMALEAIGYEDAHRSTLVPDTEVKREVSGGNGEETVASSIKAAPAQRKTAPRARAAKAPVEAKSELSPQAPKPRGRK
jgi:hypothetical protein